MQPTSVLILLMVTALSAKDGEHSSEVDTIELCIYVDKWAFEKWHTAFTALQTTGQGDNAITQVQNTMENHIRATIKGVNNIYMGLSEYGVHIDIRIASIDFIVEDIVVETEEGSGEVSRQTVLDSLSGWVKKRRKNQTPADHAMLLTGLNITGNSSDADSLGMAYVGEMCDAQRSLSVVEFQPSGGQPTLVIAHELAHSLNASHDGEDNVTCSSHSSYVMDARINHNSSNSYRFSSCSAIAIHRFLLHLRRSPKGSCLTADRSTVSEDKSGSSLGSIVSLDQLCQMAIGPQSYLHRMCQLGVCRESEKDIDVSDTCPHGDAPAYATVAEGVSCSGLAVSGRNASYCYDLFFQASCCASCADAYRPVTECEYGDKAIWCTTSQYPDVCHKNDHVCCASCLPYFNASRVGCEYGDKAAGCATLDFPRGCYKNDVLCCASCPHYYNASRVDCEYGDKAEWCAILDLPRGCYGNDGVCCASCLDMRNSSNVDCEYGDKAEWCDTADYPYVCSLNAQHCCQSCLQYYNKSNKGCEYGDKIEGCEGLPLPQACYKNGDLCCHTCRPFYRPSARGCEYGDKASWCRQSVAKDPTVCELNAEVCCESCSQDKEQNPQDKGYESSHDKLNDEL